MDEVVIGYTVYKSQKIGTVSDVEHWLPEFDSEETQEYRNDILIQLEQRILKSFPEGTEVRFDIVDSDNFEQIQADKREE